MELRNVFTEAQVDALKHDGPLLIGGLHIRLMVLQDQVEHHDGVVIAVIPSAKMLEKIDAIQGITDTYVLEGFADEQKHWLQKWTPDEIRFIPREGTIDVEITPAPKRST